MECHTGGPMLVYYEAAAVPATCLVIFTNKVQADTKTTLEQPNFNMHQERRSLSDGVFELPLGPVFCIGPVLCGVVHDSYILQLPLLSTTSQFGPNPKPAFWQPAAMNNKAAGSCCTNARVTTNQTRDQATSKTVSDIGGVLTSSSEF